MQKSFWRTAAALALPIALQNLLTSCASLIDTAMIVPLGNTAVAAVGVAGRFTFMLNLISAGFWSGAGAIISHLNIPAEEVAILLINGFHKKPHDAVKDGDVVALFPPVGGG